MSILTHLNFTEQQIHTSHYVMALVTIVSVVVAVLLFKFKANYDSKWDINNKYKPTEYEEFADSSNGKAVLALASALVILQLIYCAHYASNQYNLTKIHSANKARNTF